MPLLSGRQASLVSAASRLPEYSGWSSDDIASNLSDVLGSGDSARVSVLTSALSGLDEYSGWEPTEIQSNASDVFEVSLEAKPFAPVMELDTGRVVPGEIEAPTPPPYQPTQRFVFEEPTVGPPAPPETQPTRLGVTIPEPGAGLIQPPVPEQRFEMEPTKVTPMKLGVTALPQALAVGGARIPASAALSYGTELQALAGQARVPFEQLDPEQQQLYRRGEQVEKSGKKPKEGYDYLAHQFYQQRKNAEKVQKTFAPLGEKIVAWGEGVDKAIPEEWKQTAQDAATMVTTAESWNPEKILDDPVHAFHMMNALATTTAQQVPNTVMTLGAMLPGAAGAIGAGIGAETVIRTEAGEWIKQAKEMGIDDPDLLDKYSKMYGVPSGLVEFGTDMVLTAPLRGAVKGAKKLAPAAVKKALQGAVNKLVIAKLAANIGKTIAGGVMEGTEELAQGTIQALVMRQALEEAAQKYPEKAQEYMQRIQELDTSILSPANVQGFILGAISGGFIGGGARVGARAITPTRAVEAVEPAPVERGTIPTEFRLVDESGQDLGTIGELEGTEQERQIVENPTQFKVVDERGRELGNLEDVALKTAKGEKLVPAKKPGTFRRLIEAVKAPFKPRKAPATPTPPGPPPRADPAEIAAAEAAEAAMEGMEEPEAEAEIVRAPKRPSFEEFEAMTPEQKREVYESNPVTNRPGQPAFDRVFDERTENQTKPTLVAMGDINGFKLYNDELLGEVGTDDENRVIFDKVESVVGRGNLMNLHGDEYAFFGDNVEDMQNKLQTAMQLIADEAQFTGTDGKTYRPTMSWTIGQAQDTEQAGGINPKMTGKNRISVDKSIEGEYNEITASNVPDTEIVRRRDVSEKRVRKPAPGKRARPTPTRVEGEPTGRAPVREGPERPVAGEEAEAEEAPPRERPGLETPRQGLTGILAREHMQGKRLAFTPEYDKLSPQEKYQALSTERKALADALKQQQVSERDADTVKDLRRLLGREMKHYTETKATTTRREVQQVSKYAQTGKPTTQLTERIHEEVQDVLRVVSPSDLNAILKSKYPVRQLVKAVEAIRKGNKDGKAAIDIREEIGGLIQAGTTPDQVVQAIQDELMRRGREEGGIGYGVSEEGVPLDEKGEPIFQRITQREMFGEEERTPEEIERQRQERAEMRRRTEERKGGEAPIGELPLFEGADIEGAQMGLLQRTTPVEKGSTVEQVESWLSDVTEGTDYDFLVVQSEEELPANLQDFARAQKAEGGFRAIFDPKTGTSFLIADMLPSQERAQRAFAHEVLTHAGMRALLGERIQPVYDEIYESLSEADKRGVLRDYFPEGFDAENPVHRFRLVDEVLASRGETAVDPTLWQKFIATVRRILREMGFVGTWTENDIRDLLSAGRRAAVRGPAVGVGEAAAQVQAYHGSPYEFEKFDISKVGTGEGAQAFGYGLYFTDKKEIAKFYSKAGIPQGQKELVAKLPTGKVIRGAAMTDDYLQAARYMDLGKKDAGQFAHNTAHYAKKRAQAEGASRKVLEIIDQNPAFDYQTIKGHTYTVTLHKGKKPTQYHYMKWDEPVGDLEIEAIGREAKRIDERRLLAHEEHLKGVGIENLLEGLDGSSAYRLLSRRLGSDKAASEFLLRAGIDGIDYPAGSLSGATGGGRNYVVFDPSAVTIEERAAFQRVSDGRRAAVRGPAVGEAAAQAERRAAAPFFSPTLRAVEDLKQEKGVVPQLLSMIKKGQLKKAEVEWMGLEEWLKQNPRATRQEVAEFVRANEVVVEESRTAISEPLEWTGDDEDGWGADDGAGTAWEVIKEDNRFFVYRNGNPAAPLAYERAAGYGSANLAKRAAEQQAQARPTQYEQWQLPGAEEGSYRELLFKIPEPKYTTLPEIRQRVVAAYRNADKQTQEALDVITRQKSGESSFVSGVENGMVTSEDFDGSEAPFIQKWKDDLVELEKVRPEYRTTHWDEPDVFAHARVNDRTGPNGEKVLFIEEIQSDWAREAREKGVLRPMTDAERKRLDVLNAKMENQYGYRSPDALSAEEREEWERLADKNDAEAMVGKAGVPDFPFKKNWHEFVLKRILRMAAEQGYDRVAWTTGEQQADRYDLSKQVSRVYYLPETQTLRAMGYNRELLIEETIPKEKIADYIGKEPAKRLLEQPLTDVWADQSGVIYGHDLQGADLKIGGEWAVNLYDRMIPQFLQKYGKKWDARVEGIGLSVGTDKERLAELNRQQQEAGVFTNIGVEEVKKTTTQQSIPITPAMRESVVYEGQPMFQRVPKKPRTAEIENIENRVRAMRGKLLGLQGQALTQRGQIEAELEDYGRTRNKLRRAQARAEIAELDAKKTDAIRKAIYDYANQIGLRGERWNTVDTLLKNTKTVYGLRKAMKIMDNILERREAKRAHSKAVKEFLRVASRIPAKVRPEYKVRLEQITEKVDRAALSQAKRERLETLRNLMAEDPELVEQIPDRVRKDLRRLERTGLSEMDTEEVQEYTRALQTILGQHKLKNKLLVKGKWREHDKAVEQANVNLKENKANKIVEGYEEVSAEPAPAKLAEKVTAGAMGIDAENAELIMERVEGKDIDDPNAVISQTLYGNMDEAETQRQETLQEAEDDWKETFKDVKNWEDYSPHTGGDLKQILANDANEIELPSGRSIRTTPGHRISIYLSWQNTHNRKALLEERAVFDTNLKEHRFKLTEDDYLAIIDSMTPQELEIANYMSDRLNTRNKELLNETSRQLNGYDIAQVENYWRLLRTDLYRNYISKEARPQDIQGYVSHVLEGAGSLKERSTMARGAVVIEDAFKVYLDAVNLASAYNAYAGPLRSAKQFLQDTHDEFRRQGRAKEWDALHRWLADLEGNAVVPYETTYERAISGWMGRLAKRALGMNPVVVSRQFFSYPTAATEIEGKYLFAGLGGDHKAAREKIRKWSPQGRARIDGTQITRDIGAGAALNEAQRFYSGKTPWTDKQMAGIRWADTSVMEWLWDAAEAKVSETTELQGDEKMKATAHLWEKLVRRTQPTYMMKDRSAIARSKSKFLRLMTPFTSVTNKVLQVYKRSYMKMQRGEITKSDFLKHTAITWLSSAAAMAMIDSMRDWMFRRKREPEEILTRLASYTLSPIYFAKLAVTIPVDIYTSIRKGYPKIRDTEWNVDNMIVGAIKDLAKGGAELGVGIKEKDLNQAYKGTLRLIDTVAGSLAGVAVRNFVRYFVEMPITFFTGSEANMKRRMKSPPTDWRKRAELLDWYEGLEPEQQKQYKEDYLRVRRLVRKQQPETFRQKRSQLKRQFRRGEIQKKEYDRELNKLQQEREEYLKYKEGAE